MSRTADELCEYLNMAAEYAGCDVEFGTRPSSSEGCCFVTWGTVGAPHEKHQHEQEVHTTLCYGHVKNVPDHATWEDFALALAEGSPAVAKEIGFN
jgi:hypothetical protein